MTKKKYCAKKTSKFSCQNLDNHKRCAHWMVVKLPRWHPTSPYYIFVSQACAYYGKIGNRITGPFQTKEEAITYAKAYALLTDNTYKSSH